ncbi:hypothetical protein AA12717_2004 [Gluconacetobacter sacchari DSM 12717]|uniref:DUF2501 domain-containing protein n=2 Tax=Gluconacetobacter sacchari TaxID=92759 RepID=A0A7W4NTL2_9PROT|nr:DUF2501 domain-containing protein [Gluconacetobacter sacchari]MBB2162420.1 DUF2501 domain-containing protein [Gluconacetobacter sacchari]GBQ25208.1 hypothetical protein AA12717_2004 [Gluconacetobacter sacchari DSM 12717]
MLKGRFVAFAVSCGLVVSGAAHAQSAAAQLPAGTTLSTPPAGSVPVASPADPASNPATRGTQIVKGVTGTTTAATPGVLGENGLPSLASANAGNVAGLLSYCIHKKLVYGTTSRSTARALAKRDDVKNDQFYSVGGQGLLETGTSTPFDISTLDRSKRVELCSDLVKKGQSLSN